MGSITCEPKTLADALAAVKPAVKANSGIQALTGVRIQDNVNQTITLTSTDMGLFIRREIAGERSVVGELDVLVSHAELAKVAKAFAEREYIVLKHENDKLVCVWGNRKVELPLLRVEDMPDFPVLGGNTILEDVNGAYLAHAIERVAKFSSKDETRPLLTGVYFDREANGELQLVTTDSYRLCIRTLRGLPAWAGGFNIPAKGLVASAKLMRKVENVTLRAHHSHAIMVWPGTEIAIRLIDGQFPNYRQLLPDTWPHDVVIPMGEMRSACDLGVQFCRRNAPIRFYVNGTVRLSGNTPDGPSFEETLSGALAHLNKDLSLEEQRANELEIGWNPEFLREIAQSLEGDTVIVNLISPLRPALFHSEDDSERHLLMPVRLNV